MPSVLTLHAESTTHDAVSITHRIPLLGPRRASFFALLIPVAGTNEAARAYLARLTTTMENIARADDLLTPEHDTKRATEPDAWLAAFVQRLQTVLRKEDDSTRRKRSIPLHAAIGLTCQAQGRRTVIVTTAGGMRVRIASRNARGVVSSADVVTPEPPSVPLAFSHAMSGTLGPHDALLIGTDDAQEQLPAAALKRAFSRNTMSETVARVHQALQKNPIEASLLMVCGSSAQPVERSHASMESFIHTAALTEGFLTPKLGPSIRRYVRAARKTGTMLVAARPRRTTRRGRTTTRTNALMPAVIQSIRFTFQTIRVTLTGVGALIVDALRLIGIGTLRILHATHRAGALLQAWRKRASAEHAESHAPLEAKPSTPRAPHWRSTPVHALHYGIAAVMAARARFIALPRQSQRLLIMAIGFGLLFTSSTLALWRQNVTEQDVTSYNVLIAKIEELRSVAEARLLFGDRDEARSSFADAAALVTVLPRDSRARRERAERLSEEVTSSLDRARLLTHLEHPLSVTSGAQLGFTLLPDMVLVDRKLVLLSADRTQLTTFNPRTGDADAQRIVPVPQLSGVVRMLAMDDRTVLLIDEYAKVVSVAVANGAMTSSSIVAPPERIVDAAFFQQRLYLLHANGAITRHVRTAAGFNAGSVWLRAPEQSAGRAHLLVNGSAVLSMENGSVARYLAGNRSDTNYTETIDPPLSGPVLLAGRSESDTFFLGTPQDGRIIVMRDGGRLVGQLQSDAFLGMSAITLAGDGASLFIMAADAVYVVVPPT
ncbi:MAG: hypothetical protein Q7S96_04205 [bacterium]|nr:hypothetical protein [bacterium]